MADYYIYRASIAYDGSAYSGFQRQSKERELLTVQDTIEEVLGHLFAAPVKITVNDKSSLFLGAENKLYYPNDANDVDGTYHVNAFRAYLHIDPSAEVKEFRLRFGEDDEDGIVNANLNVNRNDGAIYNLSGQRLNKMQKGVNIVNGKKVIY